MNNTARFCDTFTPRAWRRPLEDRNAVTGAPEAVQTAPPFKTQFRTRIRGAEVFEYL